jgi:hypothetical protein
MRHRTELFLALCGLYACSDATGAIQGGQQLALPTISSSGTGSTGATSGSTGASGSASSGGMTPSATWTYLYAEYFGNPNMGGCGSIPMICHQLAMDTGVTLAPATGVMPSGFVCGNSKASCYAGLMAATPKLVSASDAANPTMAKLYLALYQGGSPGMTSNNMPQSLSYTFVESDLALISQWIQNGAPNN